MIPGLVGVLYTHAPDTGFGREKEANMIGLDQGEWSTANTYVCRACKQYGHGSRQGRLAGLPVCPSCRDRYNRERDAAEAAVDRRWLAELHSEDDR